MSTRPRRGPLSAAVLALALVLLVAAPAGAAPTKPYTVAVNAKSSPNGTVTFTATFTNTGSPQQLGSADLTVPASLPKPVVTPLAAPATATVATQTVQLRNLALAPGKSVTVAGTTSAPTCDSATQTWAVIAKQSNDFNGPPGNDLTLDAGGSTLQTKVSTACALRFATQPADASPNARITTSAFDNPPGGPVTVEVVDGAGNRVNGTNAPITLSLVRIPPTVGGILAGTTAATAGAAPAVFDPISVDSQGTYALSATSPGLSSATSSTFRIADVTTVCVANVDCTATITNPNTAYSVTAAAAGAGVLALSRVAKLDCANYVELSQTGVQVDFFPDLDPSGRTKTVVATIDKATMQADPNNGASFVEMCFGAPFTFPTKPGTPLVFDSVTGLFVGLLPDCSTAVGPPPCVLKRNKTQAGQGVITVLAPGGDQDPRYSP